MESQGLLRRIANGLLLLVSLFPAVWATSLVLLVLLAVSGVINDPENLPESAQKALWLPLWTSEFFGRLGYVGLAIILVLIPVAYIASFKLVKLAVRSRKA